MTGYPSRALTAWAALLALLWLALWSPWSRGWTWAGAALVLLVAGTAIAWQTRRLQRQQHMARPVLRAVESALAALPAGLRHHTPLVLASGDTRTLTALFGTAPVRITDAAIWVACDDATQLPSLADALMRWREGQGPDAVMVLNAADQTDALMTWQAGSGLWRRALSDTRRALGYPLPVGVAVYAAAVQGMDPPCPWFGVSERQALRFDTLPTQIAAQAWREARTAAPEQRTALAWRTAQLDALARWACEALLPALAGAAHGVPALTVQALGVTLVAGAPAAGSPWRQGVARISGLPVAALGEPASYPATSGLTLPDALLHGITPQPIRRVMPRAIAHAFACAALAFCAAAAASAWNNLALLTRVTQRITHYQAITSAHDAARLDALNALRRERDELARYARDGVPPRLGLGFYRGAPLLPRLDVLIAAYAPPAPPPATIELDSLSLFSSGSAVLNPGSNRVLVNALDLIRAHPGNRVLVAGHTDASGSAPRNQALSEARASAVRNWLAEASGLPRTRFALQGYGDTRPKATNDTAAGRALNRRVEITLVPDCRQNKMHGTPYDEPDSTPQGQRC
ncbi:OmpA family protein [Paraburkholderia bonniea]|uniref:OmpA family protein n=1 Tax=Paraburkholderia bonniea TaxID=2152891 RepID=UPI001291A688|nr:OmpA family protein [Paraburkholderia bonniea]